MYHHNNIQVIKKFSIIFSFIAKQLFYMVLFVKHSCFIVLQKFVNKARSRYLKFNEETIKKFEKIN